MQYGRITDEVVKLLTEATGPSNISVKEEDRYNYSRDEAAFAQPCLPDVVIKATDVHMVSSILAIANQFKIPVTPRGGGTGLSGGCIPVYGGMVLSLENMNHILGIDAINFSATAEPGVTLDQLNEELIKYDLCFPVHIGQMTATLGGNIATNAGGMNAVKYGVTRHHVLGLEAILADGKKVTCGGEYVKSSSGYDLTQLIIGSEGTLGVVTKIILKVMPKPACREILFVPFDSLEHAITVVPDLLRMKTIPMGIEFLERDVIQAVEQYLDYELPQHNEEAFLMIIMEGDSSEEIVQYFSQLESICRANGAVEFYAPDDERSKRKLIEFREKINPALRGLGPWEVVDAVVPRSNIARYIAKVKAVAAEYNIPIFAFGHAGDGNVHLHPTCINMTVEAWKRIIPVVMQRVYKECISLGGTISGEHGIGSEKKKYLPMALNESTLALMQSIKTVFDPNNILNPGKIFDN